MAICLWEMQFKENVRQEERTWRGEGTFSTHVRMARIAVHTGIIGCRNVSRGWHREANGLVTWLLLGSHMTTARGSHDWSHDYCQGDHMTGHMTSVKGITWLVTWLLLKGSHDYCQGVTKTIHYWVYTWKALAMTGPAQYTPRIYNSCRNSDSRN